MKEAVFYEVFDEEAAALKKNLPAAVRPFFFKNTIQETKKKRFAPIVSIRTQSVIPDDWAFKLSGVLTRSTGYDHLLAYRKKTATPAVFGYLPDYCSRSVAEHAMLLVMALRKHLKCQISQFSRFERDHLTGGEILNTNLLVLGVGRIGTEIVSIARGCGMRVKGVDIDPRLAGLEYVPLEEGLKWARIVVSALPLTDGTRGLLSYAALKKGQKGQIFVNVGRGEVAPLSGLKRLLDERFLAGLGLDVFEEEGLLAEALRGGRGATAARAKQARQMAGRDNVIFTPHNAFNTRAALDRKAHQTIHSIRVFQERGVFPYALPE